uniref:Uncharacterized protein LOC104218903 isoform X2 n=1 Tax=Nicotiana sylvestris TaxID=4096 RepID=A0A1U7W0K0_NICSY|nr:PREDICTED: uncharacterized protein LOC104218903 isoform X2 [Nicotiana sylvestris]
MRIELIHNFSGNLSNSSFTQVHTYVCIQYIYAFAYRRILFLFLSLGLSVSKLLCTFPNTGRPSTSIDVLLSCAQSGYHISIALSMHLETESIWSFEVSNDFSPVVDAKAFRLMHGLC